MPAPKKTHPTSGKFLELCKSSREFGENNDCAVKAVALAANVPYAMAHSTLELMGRKRRCGTYTFDTRRAMKALGYDMVVVDPSTFIKQYPKPHCDVLKGCTTHHMDRFHKVWANGKTYMIVVPGHILTVINGVNHDWTQGKAKRVQTIYEIVKL